MKNYSNLSEETIQSLYKKNLVYFKEFHNEIYLKIQNFNRPRKYNLVLNEYMSEDKIVLIPNVEIIDSQTYAYQDNPLIYSSNFAKNSLNNDEWLRFISADMSSLDNINKIVFISNGLGFHYEEYTKRFDIKSILIIEEDVEIFLLSMFIVDYEKLAINKQLLISVEDDFNLLKNKVLRFYYSLFFYNNKIKIAQPFQNNIVNNIAKIFKENINIKVFSKKLNYDEILEDEEYQLNKKDFYTVFTKLKKDVRLNHPFDKSNIYVVIQLLNTLLKLNISNEEYITLTNKLYYYVYLISYLMDERFEQFKCSAYLYLEYMDEVRLLTKDIYNDMIKISYSVKDFDTAVKFSSSLIEYLKKDENRDDELLSYTIYKLKALKGESLDKSSKEYVKFEFDNFAKSFENVLIGSLNYKTPKLISEKLLPHLDSTRTYSILDLGCGTGLIGDELKNVSNKLVGLDLSSEMLKIAEKKNIYSDLIECDIEEYLSNLEENKYDIIVAADVFVYIGELFKIFKYTKSIIKSNGIFAFSIELTEKKDYELNKSGRFAHSINYIKLLSKEFGYLVLLEEIVDLRLESDKYVKGVIIILKEV